MSRKLQRVDDLNVSKKAKNVIADSTLTFYQDLNGDYYYSDIYNSKECPIANLMLVGSIEDVEDMLTSEE